MSVIELRTYTDNQFVPWLTHKLNAKFPPSHYKNLPMFPQAQEKIPISEINNKIKQCKRVINFVDQFNVSLINNRRYLQITGFKDYRTWVDDKGQEMITIEDNDYEKIIDKIINISKKHHFFWRNISEFSLLSPDNVFFLLMKK